MTGAFVLLFLAWIVGCIGIIRSGIRLWWIVASCFLFGVALGGITYWIASTKPETPFSVEVRSAMVFDSGPLTMFMVGYPSMFGVTASPVFYLAYMQITNLQDFPASISDLKIAASKEREGPWEDLVPIPLVGTTLFTLGISTPHPKTLRMSRGTYRIANTKTQDDMKLSAIVNASPALETEIGKPIAPHATVRGWIALDSLRRSGLTPGQIYFRIKMLDAANKSSLVIAELPSKQPGDSSLDVNCGEIQIVGVRTDISGYHVKYYGDPFPTPH